MNVSLEYSKTLAGEGSILLLLGLVPYAGWILGIIGVILLLRGLKELSNYYQDEEIYKNALTGVKFYIVALVAAGVAIAALTIGIGSATGFTFKTGFVPTAGFGVGLVTFFAGLIVAFVFYVLATSHLRRTFNTLAQKSGEASFATAGKLLWWGAILTIVLVGLVLIFIAWIFVTIGFFTMKPQHQQQYNPQQYAYTPPSTQPAQGKVIESKGMNHNNYALSETLGGRGL
jgi:uncharacterized membrane protein